MERLLPGMGDAVVAYNDILTGLCQKHDAVLVDAYGLVRREGIEIQPDGCHFTAQGHRLLHDLLWERLAERFPRLQAVAPTPDS
jgi:lysophospholipase L1-like esterase